MRRRSLLAGGGAFAMESVLAGFASRTAVARSSARRLRLGHNNNVDSITHACATAFADAVAKRSDGRLLVDVVPDAMLGSESRLMKAVAEGTLDLSLPPSGVASAYSPLTALIELPYLFRDPDHARRALSGALGSACAAELLTRGVRVLGWGEIGVRQMTANRPIRRPADVRGLRLRVPLSEPILHTFRAFGAAAETLAFPQLPEALRSGRIEAQENPINVILDSRLYELQSHLSLTRHVYTPIVIVLSGAVFDTLDEEEREVLRSAASVGALASRRHADKLEAHGLATLREHGMTIVEDVDHAAFRKAVAALGDDFAQVFGDGVLARVRALAES